MNPIIITVIISAATFILTIFSALYLNQRHTDKLIEQLEKRLDEQARRFEMKVDEQGRRFEAKLDGLQQTMNARFDSVGLQLSAMDRRLASVESRLDRLENILFKPVLP